MTGTEESEPRRLAWPTFPGRATIGGRRIPMETRMDREDMKDEVLRRLDFLERLVALTIEAHWKHAPLSRGQVDRIAKLLHKQAFGDERFEQMARHWHGQMLEQFSLGEGPTWADSVDEWSRRFEEMVEWRRRLG